MKVNELLNKEEIKKLRDLNKRIEPNNFSKREIEELMGMYRDTYIRVNGAIRRKR